MPEMTGPQRQRKLHQDIKQSTVKHKPFTYSKPQRFKRSVFEPPLCTLPGRTAVTHFRPASGHGGWVWHSSLIYTQWREQHEHRCLTRVHPKCQQKNRPLTTATGKCASICHSTRFTSSTINFKVIKKEECTHYCSKDGS